MNIVGVFPTEAAGIEIVAAVGHHRLDQEIDDFREDDKSLIHHPDKDVILERADLVGEFDKAGSVIRPPYILEFLFQSPVFGKGSS
jgi:hypothetical protein